MIEDDDLACDIGEFSEFVSTGSNVDERDEGVLAVP
jgi:hypothetical protein